MTTFEFKMTPRAYYAGWRVLQRQQERGCNGCFAPYVRCWQRRVFCCIFCCKMWQRRRYSRR